MSKRIILIPIALLLIASPSWAQDSAPNYGRSGWYAGVGAGVAIDFLKDAVSDVTGGPSTSRRRAPSTHGPGTA